MLGTYSANMRDTSRDYQTYWIRNGEWYGKMRTLGEATCRIPDEILRSIPEPDRQVVVEEAAADSKFCEELVRISKHPGWEHKISQSAKCALLNELDPSKCRDYAGKWGRLRSRLRKLLDEVPAQIDRAVGRMTLPEKMAVVRKIAAGERPVPSVSGLGELGQWDIISGLVGSVATASANIYTAKVTTDAQRDIAKIQASTAMRDAQTAMAMQQAQAEVNTAKTVQAGMLGPISSLTSASVGGVPVWLIAIPVLGAIAWFAFKK